MERKEIEHLAELSKLKFTDEEYAEISTQIDSLVDLANVVKNSSISGGSYYTEIKMEELREDKVEDSTPVDVLLKNSPIVKKDSIVVPKIME